MTIQAVMRVELQPVLAAELDALYQFMLAKQAEANITVSKDAQRGVVFFEVNHDVDV